MKEMTNERAELILGNMKCDIMGWARLINADVEFKAGYNEVQAEAINKAIQALSTKTDIERMKDCFDSMGIKSNIKTFRCYEILSFENNISDESFMDCFRFNKDGSLMKGEV